MFFLLPTIVSDYEAICRDSSMTPEFRDKRDRATVFQAFQICFTFLSQVYLDSPHQEFIQQLVDDDLFSVWPLSSASSSTSTGLGQLQKFCSQWNPQQMEKLNLDYTRLFVGLEKTLAPPYESVFLGKEHTLFEACTLEVREFYRRFDVHINPIHKIPDDHLGLELAFCASLFQKHVDASEAKTKKDPHQADYRQGLEQFLSRHLLQWINPFTSIVISSADTLYYRGIAFLTLGTVTDCAEFLELRLA